MRLFAARPACLFVRVIWLRHYSGPALGDSTMLNEQEIIQMFAEMGLEDEAMRQHFIDLAKLSNDRQENSPQIFIRIATTTQPIDEVDHVQLG
jgi:hypothetical protein